LAPATVNWSNPAGGNWDVGYNWSTGQAPGTGDIAVINTTLAATITIQSGDTIQVQGLTTGSNDTLSITGGSLTVTNGASTLSGALAMTGGSLTASGSGVNLTANGSTTISGANLDAEGGATLSLPQLTSYTSQSTTFQASGTGSRLDVSALSNLTQQGSWTVNASSGGTVNLSSLTSLTATYALNINALSGGTVNLSSLTSLTNSWGLSLNIQDIGGSTILDSQLTSLNYVNVALDGADAHVADSWTTLSNGSLTVTGGSYNLAGLTDVDGSSLFAQDGGQLALPNLTSYTTNYTTFEASGTGSVLDVSALSSLTWQGAWTVEALSGGTVNLSGLTSVTAPSGFAIGGVYGGTINLSSLTSVTLEGSFDVYATSGTVNLSSLTSLTSTYGLYIPDTVLPLVGSLTSLNGVNVTLDSTDLHAADHWTTFLNGTLTVTGGSFSLPNLTDVDGASLYVSNGASLTLPNLTSCTTDYTTFQASGTGSVLDVSPLSNLTQQGNWTVNALSGGTVNLSGLTSLSAADYVSIAAETGGTVNLSSLTSLTATYILNIKALSGGTVNLSSLTSLTATSSYPSSITDTGGSTILDSQLTSLNGVSVALDGTDPQVANSWTTLSKGSLTVTGGSYNLAGLTDVDGSSLEVSNGANLTLPNLTSYTIQYTAFEASGTGSVLDVSALSSLTWQGGWTVEALSGGTVNLSGLTSLSAADYVSTAAETGGTINLSSLTSLSATGPLIYITDTGHSTILDSRLPSLNGVNVTLDGTDAHVANSWTTLTNGTLTVTGGSFSLPDLTSFASSNLYLSGGAALILPVLTQGNITLSNGTSATIQGTLVNLPASGTVGATITVPQSSGLTVTLPNSGTLTGTTFDVGAGSGLVLSGGTYAGTLTGVGGGTVQLTSGRLFIGSGGLTLNFAGSMFQWTGGVIDAGQGDLTNLGTMNLSGNSDMDFYNDGLLDNFGTILQTGTGNLHLGTDGTFPATLKNEAGASYLLEGDGGLTEISDSGSAPGQTSLNNAGIIRKTGGTGTSSFDVLGSITNTGTIEADSGTLALNPTLGITQISGSTLAAGTWNALSGATLEFPTGTSFTTNAATVSLDGAGATIPALADLATNNGNFSLTGGATFTTAGDLSNSGSLTVGTGSTLTVAGNYTQTATAALNDQFGGTTASAQFGTVAVLDAANLGGNFNVSLLNGATPNRNAVYPVMTFASASGTFTTVSGLSPYFTEQFTSTSLDLVNGTSPPVDLQLSQVTAPTTAMPGQQLTVNWQVSNSGSTAANGSWQDSVYLSTTPAITSSSVLLGSVTHTGGLAASGSYITSLTAAVPALLPGYDYVLVLADSLDQVPVTDRANDTLAAANQLQVLVPALTLGTAYSDSFTGNDQGRYYQITGVSGSLLLTMTGSPASEENAIYVSLDSLPTTYQADYQSSGPAGPDPTLAVPTTTGGTYYILVYNESGVPGAFNLTASVPGLTLLTASPGTVGNAGQATLTVTGLDLETDTTYALQGPSGTITAAATDNVSAALAYVTFNFAGVTPGAYELEATNDNGATTTLAGAVQVTGGGGANVVASLVSDSPVRIGRTSVFYVQYANVGNDDAPAPLLTLTSPLDIPMTLDATVTPEALSLDVLGVNQNGPAAVLPPGARGQFAVYFLPASAGSFEFDVTVTSPSDTEQFTQVDWNDNILSAISSNVTSAASWPAVETQLEQMSGATWGSYVNLLDHYAALLPSTMGDPSSPADVLQLAVNQAVAGVGPSISGEAVGTGPGVLLKGNTVTATNSTTGDSFSATILNDGSFVFSTVTPGSYTFSVPNDLIAGSPAPVTVSAGQAVTGVTVTLAPEVLLAGKVTEAATGAPVAGASVFILSGAGPVDVGTTDADGDYSLAFVPGSYTLMVAAPDLARFYSDVTFAPGPAELNVTLAGESAVTGTVSLSDGQAVQNLTAIGVLQGSEPYPYFSATFTSGEFRLGSLAPGVYDFTFSVPGYNDVTLSGVQVGQGQTVDLGAIQLSPPDPPDSTLDWLKTEAMKWIQIWSTAHNPGLDAQKIFNLYFNSTAPNPANTVIITDQDDVDAFRYSPTTFNAFLETLNQIGDQIGTLPEVYEAIQNLQCGTTTTLQWPVTTLMPKLGLGGWMWVTQDPSSLYKSPQQALDIWAYQDGTLGAIIAGGVGHGPGPNGTTLYDSRDLAGTVTLSISSNGQATLTANFFVNIQDRFAFNLFTAGHGPITKGNYNWLSWVTAAGVVGLGVLEAASMTGSVPFSVGFFALPVSISWRFDTGKPDCGTPKGPKKSTGGTVVVAQDPNALSGPAGYGTQGFIPDSGTLPYTIDFENDGSAAAQDVTVTEQLAPNLNWSTFQLGSFGWGSVNVTVPAGLTHYQTTVSYQNADGTSLNVQVTLDFNVATGLLTVNFVSLDPLTGQAPTGVFDGFLYPESESAVASDGYVQYTVQPRVGLTTGTTINQQAAVVFDTNAALKTAVVTNIIDATPPTSSINPLPVAVGSANFTVSWSGSDSDGSGIASYDVYVSDDGGPFTPLLTKTTLTSAPFTGQDGHTYSFYCVATDNVGNQQATPTAPQATTTVQTQVPTITSVTTSAANGTYGIGASIGINVSFSTAVDVTGTPSLALNSGGMAYYSGGTGTSTLTFTYTAGLGDSSRDLDYSGSNALSLNGGSITQHGLAGGTNNANTSLSGASDLLQPKHIVINTTAPTITLVGSSLYIVGGSSSNDQVQISSAGSSNTGSTGLRVSANLNRVSWNKTYSPTTVYIVGFNGNDNVQVGGSLTIPMVISFGNGNNNLHLGNGNETVTLGAGNDDVQAGNGSNTITGGKGHYNVQLGNGNDTIFLGGGNDNVQAGNGNDSVTVGNGNDNVQLGGGSNVVMLGSGNDNVQAGNGNNAITAGSGKGNDNVQLGKGNNTVTLSNGNGNVQLGDGSNVVVAGNGNDNIRAGNGNDTITAGSGNDNVQLGKGNKTATNTVTLGNGNDNVNLGDGSNVFVEGNGNDNVQAGNGSNLIVGGLGQHVIQVGNGSNILIDGSVQLTQSGDSLAQVLSDWTCWGATPANVASIRSRLKVTDNTHYANALHAGSGIDWFWATYARDHLNRKATDLLN